MKNPIILLSIVAFLFLTPIVHAGSVVTVTDAVNANGSIGLYIKNELGILIYTDSTQNDRTVLSFSVNGSNTTINTEKSALELPKEQTKFVVLNKEWPAGGYYNVDITYRDAGGGLYPKETYTLFAKSPISLEVITIEPTKIFSNVSRVTYKAKVKASGEASVSNINFRLISNPKYYLIEDSKTPGALSQGSSSDMQLIFDRDDRSFPDTVIYTTVYIPFEFTYSTMGFQGQQSFNYSFVIFNAVSSAGVVPKLDAKISVPESAEPGKTVSVPVYVWNSNVGGNSACNVTLKLSSNSSGVSIQSPDSSVEGELKGRVDANETPSATFDVAVSDSAASGNYALSLRIDYVDCSWKNSDYVIKSETLSVAKSGEPVVKDEPKIEPPVETEKKEPIVNISVKEPSVETQAIGGLFVVVIAIVGVLVLFGLVYFLELRSRTVY